MKYLHAMIRTTDLDASLQFYCDKLGFVELRRKEVEDRDIEEGRFTLVFLASQQDAQLPEPRPEIELQFNHEANAGYAGGRNFGHLSFVVDNIYDTCQRLLDNGVTVNRPPKDGRMAFIVTPENITLELIQSGEPLKPAEPWASMKNSGTW